MKSIFFFLSGAVLALSIVVPRPIPLSSSEERREPIRVEQFDARGRRTGHVIIDPKTGRVDQYDARSRHTGTGRVENIQPSLRELRELTKPRPEPSR